MANWTEPSCGVEEFQRVVTAAVSTFAESRMLRLIQTSAVKPRHYQSLLLTIFHQTWNGPYSFAAAAASCPWRFSEAKEYLLDHAVEEKAHWRWVLDDLRSIGYSGPDPREEPAHPTALAYLALNNHLAQTMPIARLATAAVLEGIGPTYAHTHVGPMLRQLKLGSDAASFLISHGETDKVHRAELMEVIERLQLSPIEWAEMCAAAITAGRLYVAMYDHEGFV